MRSLGAKASTALPCAASALFVATFPLYHAVGQANGRAGSLFQARQPPAERQSKCLSPQRETVTGGCPERTKEISMFLAVFFVLLVLWLMGFFAFHIAVGSFTFC